MSRSEWNSRLDAIKAATVIENLQIFEEEIETRNNMRRCDRPWPARTASRRPQPDNITSTLAQYTLPMACRPQPAVMCRAVQAIQD